ncbi:LLM class flavin-dependent oxidoreductase [Ornithinimicrobium sediminis]|uniref:LLM class flavin-dependent oxidoreductase n=1 Tax=Ornithinimicrobium sediminis TaxID=2904603 RepID=UPI001E361870|nr:LLM class flavin-dependent oxidoreductase [Ornithinimicrobium sediminis]MCE0487480.1 LLM class flavin-dependent oxidoreductase [Ornithinimicrobium sediminis]
MRDVRYGICILPEHPWRQAEPLWRHAEERGFDHAWTYDHLVWGGLPDSPWHSTVATLTAAAMVTERIRLGTFVASPNYRHPVTFTRDVVTLDDISHGRVVLGLGTGGERDAQILGQHLSRGERTRRFAEFVDLLDRTLTTDHVDHQGEFYGAVDARNVPGCVQQPRVPFVVAANGPKAMALAARQGQGWVTTGPAGQAQDLTDTAAVDAWWDGVGELSERFCVAVEQAVADGHRPGGHDPDRYLSLDSSGVPALRSPGFFAEQVGRARELGFTDVIVHWPRPEDPYRADPAVLDHIELEP